jgi:hypothetical protein
MHWRNMNVVPFVRQVGQEKCLGGYHIVAKLVDKERTFHPQPIAHTAVFATEERALRFLLKMRSQKKKLDHWRISTLARVSGYHRPPEEEPAFFGVLPDEREQDKLRRTLH